MKKLLLTAQEKGASSWLSCLPIQRLGYSLNKQEFQDAVAMRYNWPIKGMPKHCACGAVNDIDHALTCKKGSYVSLRHNNLRDTEANLMREVAKDIVIEPSYYLFTTLAISLEMQLIKRDWTSLPEVFGLEERKRSLVSE